MNQAPNRCPNCNAPLQPGALQCAHCGRVLSAQAGSTGTPGYGAGVPTPHSYRPAQTGEAAPGNNTPGSYAAPVQPQAAPAQSAYTAPRPVQPQNTYSAPAAPPAQPQAAPTQSAYTAPRPAQPQNTYSAPAAPPAQPQNTYSAPAAPPAQPQNTYSAPTGQPGQFGQPGAYPTPQQAGGFGGGQPPYGTGTPPPARKPKKKKNVVVIILLVVALLAIAAVAGYFVWQNMQEKKLEQSHTDLVDKVCAATTPGAVAAFEDEVNSFYEEHEELINDDLLNLLRISKEFENDYEDEYRYITALDAYEVLADRAEAPVSTCAQALGDYVQGEYDDFLLQKQKEKDEANSNSDSDSDSDTGTQTDENFTPPEDFGPGAFVPLEVVGEAEVTTNDDGEPVWRATLKNNSKQRIDYCEMWAFTYDAQGEPLDAEELQMNIDFAVDFPFLDPGETYEEEYGFYLVEGAAYCYVYVNYVEFADGSTYGYSMQDNENIDAAFDLMVRIKLLADSAAKKQATAVLPLPAPQLQKPRRWRMAA